MDNPRLSNAARTLDGRYTDLAVLPVVRVTDATSDIIALAQESDCYLVRAHSAHVANDWGRYLDAVDRIHSTHLAIRDTARRLAGAAEEAPRLSPDQMAFAYPALRVVA